LLHCCTSSPTCPASERRHTPPPRNVQVTGSSTSYLITHLALLALSRILLPLWILDILITLLILILVITEIILILIIFVLKVSIVQVVAKESFVLQRLAGEPVDGTGNQLLLDVLAEGVVEL